MAHPLLPPVTTCPVRPVDLKAGRDPVQVKGLGIDDPTKGCTSASGTRGTIVGSQVRPSAIGDNCAALALQLKGVPHVEAFARGGDSRRTDRGSSRFCLCAGGGNREGQDR